jgi:hypothetical protein
MAAFVFGRNGKPLPSLSELAPRNLSIRATDFVSIRLYENYNGTKQET